MKAKKEAITEEMGIYKDWETVKPKTLTELAEFQRHLIEDYNHDYGTCVHAAANAARAAYDYFAHELGMTGFQMGCVMWSLVSDLHSGGKGVPLRLFDYSDLLYPQYESKFAHSITPGTWEWLQAQAKTKLKETEPPYSPAVKAHWQSIVAGVVPFGMKVTEDD